MYILFISKSYNIQFLVQAIKYISVSNKHWEIYICYINLTFCCRQKNKSYKVLDLPNKQRPFFKKKKKPERPPHHD